MLRCRVASQPTRIKNGRRKKKKKHETNEYMDGKQNIQSRCPGLSMVDLCGTSINPEAFARSDGEGEGDVIQGGAPLPWHTY